MSIISRNSLKAEFVSGTAATQSKFEDVFDSHYNRYEDSVLLGPVGVTGQYGLLGPTGPTTFNGLLGPEGATFYNGLLGPAGSTSYTGLWISTGATPSGPTASGSTGNVIFDNQYMYICTQTNTWLRITGATSF